MRTLLVPGFTQTPSSWDGVRALLAAPGTEVIALEVPAGLAWDATVAALAAAGGRGTWVGYSMGGRLALQLALDRPELVERLVLVSATAGLRSPAERATRVAADAELARQVLRDGVAAFVERWLARPLFAGVPADAPGLTDRARWTAGELAAQLTDLGTGAMPDLWERLGELTMPVVIVTGDDDEKFSRIGDQLAAACTHTAVTRVRIPGGHALPLEQPVHVAAAIRT